MPLDLNFLAPDALKELPGKDILSKLNVVLTEMGSDLKKVAKDFGETLKKAANATAEIATLWDERKQTVQAEFENILRELQKAKIDGQEFINLKSEIEKLRPFREKTLQLVKRVKELRDQRRTLIADWTDLKTEEYRALERAAKRVSRQLRNKVKVSVQFSGNREPLIKFLRENIGGRLDRLVERIKEMPDLSLIELADAATTGKDSLAEKFEIPSSQAERMASASHDTLMQLEVLELPAVTQIELNIAPEGQTAVWKSLKDLSKGQKATAVLMLLLLESEAPLIVDQPEDDLDNRFITEGIVPKMRDEKLKRQFIFSTHNANIPVLGDAELIVGLIAVGEADFGKAEMPEELMGSIDSSSVRELVEELLEGGKEAFERRRERYGF